MARSPSRRTSKFALSPEERAERRDAASQQLTSAVESLTNGDTFRAALRMARLFPTYSFGNTLMIGSQKPDATRVCGFNTWKKLGRSVKKGEKGIRIFVPMRLAARESRDPAVGTRRNPSSAQYTAGHARQGGDGTTASQGRDTRLCFTVGSVFDVSQTEGEPLPEPPTPKILTGDSPLIRAAIAGLCDYNAAHRIPVSFTTLEGLPETCNGVWYPSKRCIEVREDLPPLQRLKTLAHETAHGRLHEQVATSQEGRREEEVEAESTAYLVLESLGIDGASEYSFPYVAQYAETPERLLGVVERARVTAAAITDAMYHTINQQLGTAFVRGIPLDVLESHADPTTAAETPIVGMQGVESPRVAAVEDREVSQRADAGLFIVIEGANGVGKTTVLPYIAEHLQRTMNRKVVCVREPGGTPTGEAIRTALKAGTEAYNPSQQLEMFCAARRALVDTIVRPELEAGSIVIADRHTLSSYVYQGGAGVPFKDIAAANAAAVGNIRPDATVVLWAPHDELRDRQMARYHTADVAVIGAATTEAFDRQARYIALADKTPGAITVAVRPTPAATAEAVLDRLAHIIAAVEMGASDATTDPVDEERRGVGDTEEVTEAIV